MLQSKTCNTCSQTKPLSEFDNSKDERFGKAGKCKVCRRAYVRAWAKNHPEVISQRHKNRVAKDPEKERERHRIQYLKNKDNKPSISRRRRAAKQQVLSEFYTASQVLEKYGTCCHICGTLINLDNPRRCGMDGWETGLQIDHLIPLSKGGADTLSNVRPAHGLCNARKGAK